MLKFDRLFPCFGTKKSSLITSCSMKYFSSFTSATYPMTQGQNTPYRKSIRYGVNYAFSNGVLYSGKFTERRFHSVWPVLRICCLRGNLRCGSCRDGVAFWHKPAHEINQHADKLVYFMVNLNPELLKFRLNQACSRFSLVIIGA